MQFFSRQGILADLVQAKGRAASRDVAYFGDICTFSRRAAFHCAMNEKANFIRYRYERRAHSRGLDLRHG